MVKICDNATMHSNGLKTATTRAETNGKEESEISSGMFKVNLKEKQSDIQSQEGTHTGNSATAKKQQQQQQNGESQGTPAASRGRRKGSCPGDRLPEANVQLVEALRGMLKHEFKENSELYSRPHYDDIMDPSCPNNCWRYLLQRDEDVEQAFELAKATLKWRQDNKVDLLRPATLIKDFWLRAPIGFTGKTKSGNDLIYAIGKNFRKPDPSVKQTVRDFITFLLFDWDRRHKLDLEQIELVFDVSDTGLRNIDLDFSSWLVSIRDFVPARVQAIYFVGIPFILRPIIRLIISWLPERFKRIAHCGSYDQLVRANVDEDCIPEEIGGKADNKWRLAPVESQWAHEISSPQANEIFEKICQACSFNTTQEYLDKVYKMQMDYEKSLKA